MNLTPHIIKRKRLGLNLSQGELALLAKCHCQQISQIERNVTTIPIPLAKRLAKALGIPSWQMRSFLVKDYAHKLQEKW